MHIGPLLTMFKKLCQSFLNIFIRGPICIDSKFGQYALIQSLDRQLSSTVQLTDHMVWDLKHFGLFFSHRPPHFPLLAHDIFGKEDFFFSFYWTYISVRAKLTFLVFFNRSLTVQMSAAWFGLVGFKCVGIIVQLFFCSALVSFRKKHI